MSDLISRSALIDWVEKLNERLEEYKYSHLTEHDSEECLHCKENEDDWNCFNRNCLVCVCDRTISIVNELAEEYKPKTQADKIRSMSDEELADMLHNIGSYVENGEPLIDIYIGEDKSTVDDSFEFILDWLQSEAE